MLIFKKHKIHLKILIILSILSIFLMTSCAFKSLREEKSILFENYKKTPNKLIIPKGTNFPEKNEKYDFPYTTEDFKKKNHDIFPPV